MGTSELKEIKISIFSPISETEKITNSKFEQFKTFLKIIKSETFVQELRQRGYLLSSLRVTEFYMRHYYETISSKLLMRKKDKPDIAVKDTELVNHITEDSIVFLLYNLVGTASTKVYIDFDKYLPTSNKCFFVAVDLDEFFQDPVFSEEDIEYFRQNEPPDFIEKQIFRGRKGWITGEETGESLDEHTMREYTTKLNLGCSANHPESVLKLFEFVCNVLQDESLYDPPLLRYIDFYND